jgi:hypothetical protein
MPTTSSPGGQGVAEYQELGQNLRHYSNMQYVNLTIAFAVQAALLSVVFRDPPASSIARVVVSLGGVLTAALFYIHEHRIRSYWYAYFARACVLEVELGFGQYHVAPRRKILSSGAAMRTLYIVIMAFWMFSVFGSGLLVVGG